MSFIVSAFDFDGTITSKDSFIEFIRFTHKPISFIIGFLYFSPILILMKLKLYSNFKAKQFVFSYFFKNMEINDFNFYCKNFASHNRNIIKQSALDEIEFQLLNNHEIVIISSSISNWISPFFINSSIHIIATEIEIDSNGFLTGKFSTNNCFGIEKVNRLLSIFPNRNEYKLFAYGDSRGDKELLDFADVSYYKLFK